MIMKDEGLGFIHRGVLPRLPSMSPMSTAYSRNSGFAKVRPSLNFNRHMSPATVRAVSRNLANRLVRNENIIYTARAQERPVSEIVRAVINQPSVRAAVTSGASVSLIAAQLAKRPELVTDAMASQPALMQRVSPTVDVTDVPPEYSAAPARPEAQGPDEDDIFADLNRSDDEEGMGNIRSSIMLPEIRGRLGYASSEMGDIFSDIVGGYMTRQGQNTSIALAQQQSAQAQAAARIAEAQARAATANKPSQNSFGLPFNPLFLLPVASIGIFLLLKMRKRK